MLPLSFIMQVPYTLCSWTFELDQNHVKLIIQEIAGYEYTFTEIYIWNRKQMLKHSRNKKYKIHDTMTWQLSKWRFIIIIYFENVHFFHARLGLDVCTDMKSLHITRLVPCHHLHTLPKSPYPYTCPQQPPHLYKLTPDHPHSYVPDAQTISICHASSLQPHSVYPEYC